MAYPSELLNPDEQIILDLKPHWVALLIPTCWTAGIAAVMILIAWLLSGLFVWLLPVALVVWGIFAIWPFLKWRTTEFVLTSQRVVSRHGVLAKHAKDIPLDRINEVVFRQSLFERMCGSGNLTIRSASEDREGNKFRFIREPEQVQNRIYRAMESEQRDISNTQMQQYVSAAQQAQQQAPPQTPPAPDIAAQIAQLGQLRDQGLLTDEEFQAKKAELLGRM